MFRYNKLWMVLLLVIILFLGVSLAWGWVRAASTPQSAIGWQQVNESGFGSMQVINTLETFNGQIYAGTYNPGGVAQIWRANNSWNWEQFSPKYPTATDSIYDTQVFSNYLYIGTGSDSEVIAEIWRTDGSSWENVVQGGFGDENNLAICTLMVYSNTLVAATAGLTGVEIWGSPIGDAGTWVQENEDGFNLGIAWISTMEAFDGYLYFGSGREDGAALLRTDDLKNWTTVFTGGLGNLNNTMVASMAEFKGAFYVGFRNLVEGAEVWRTMNGVDFSPVITGGNGILDDTRPYGLIEYNDQLYLVLSNYSTGAEVWRTSDGETWDQVGFNGWGDPGNYYGGYFDKTGTIFINSLYFGTYNPSGGQIWQMLFSPDTLTISGPTSGELEIGYVYTGAVTPITATVPITYLWQATDYAPYTMTGGITSTIVYNWAIPGMKGITLTASNAAGSTSNINNVYISAANKIFLPISLK